jgi:hypothetical protein
MTTTKAAMGITIKLAAMALAARATLNMAD